MHAVLDPLWRNTKRNKKARRSAVYQYLSEELGIPRSDTHTAMFDSETCFRAIKALKKFKPAWKVEK